MNQINFSCHFSCLSTHHDFISPAEKTEPPEVRVKVHWPLQRELGEFRRVPVSTIGNGRLSTGVHFTERWNNNKGKKV